MNTQHIDGFFYTVNIGGFFVSHKDNKRHKTSRGEKKEKSKFLRPDGGMPGSF